MPTILDIRQLYAKTSYFDSLPRQDHHRHRRRGGDDGGVVSKRHCWVPVIG